jgi:hypothetical protein
MTNNTNKPTVEDFVEALPSGNEVIRTGNWIVTNCVHPTHEDKDPSMLLRQGDNNVIIKCKSRDCDKQELLSYFYKNIPYYVNRKREYELKQKKWEERKKRRQQHG